MFKLKDTNLFYMPGGNPSPTGDYFVHLATIEDNFNEYIAFCCIKGPHQGQAYIEQAVLISNSNQQQVAANLKQITDDNLFNELHLFLQLKGILNLSEQYNKMIDQGIIKL